MRFNATLKGIAMAFLAGGMLASCTNDLNEPGYGNNGALPASPVKTPEVIAWSGNYTFGNAVGKASTRAAGDVVTFETVETTLIDRKAEEAFIDEKLPEKNGNLSEDLDLDFLFDSGSEGVSFEIYPVYSQTHSPNDLTVFYFQDPNHIGYQTVWKDMNPWGLTESKWDWSEELGSYEVVTSKGVKITIAPGYYFGFTWKGNILPVEGEQLRNELKDVQGYNTVFYSSSGLNDLSYCTDGDNNKLEGEPTSRTHAVRFEHDGKTYLGFEDWNDFDYQDWVFTCNVALKNVDSSEFFPEDGSVTPTPPTPPTEDPECPAIVTPGTQCPHHDTEHNPDGSCPKCEPGQPCYKDHSTTDPTDPSDPTDPEDPTDDPVKPGKPNVKGDNEVEINFALNDVHGDYDIQDLVTKLSLHVRYPHDIEVIIPVPEQIYCDQDDLYILKSHNADYTYGGQKNTVSYVIDGHTISLTVEFVTAENDNLTTAISITDKNGQEQNYGKGYIRVYTEGINPEVIKYLNENYGDGVNFEVYNYFNRATQYPSEEWPEIDYFDLQYYYLSHSLVNFDWQEDFANKVYPDSYINAFHQVNGQPNPGDCYVWIFGDNRANNVTNTYKDVEYHGGKLVGGTNATESGNYEIAKFWNAYQGDHKNGSSTNWIFVNKSVKDSAEPTTNAMPDDGKWPFLTPNHQEIGLIH